jgi:Rieske Fe-S protein
MGAVIRRGSSKSAVSRDDKGSLHVRSAVCLHLSCIVSWNSTERTWDCPCHGSRFTPDGKLLNGPALNFLEKVPFKLAK